MRRTLPSEHCFQRHPGTAFGLSLERRKGGSSAGGFDYDAYFSREVIDAQLK
jgi:hypothetical protein